MFMDTNNTSNIKKNILLVEDEAILALSKSMDLRKYGYKCHHSLSGEKAIEIINQKKEPVDLILMDIDLGSGLDGIQTAREILTNYDVPILFHSSHEEQGIVAKTEEVTSYGYVVKSSSITVLDASIKMAFKLYDNVCKRRLAVEETIKINKLLRTTIDGISEPIMQIGTDYKILMNNKAVKDKYNFDKNIEPAYCYQVSHNQNKPCSGTEHPCPLNCVKETLKPCSNLHKHIQKDGSIRLVELRAEPLLDINGKLTGIIETAHDITEQKITEDLVINNNKKLTSILAAAPTGIGLVTNRKITEVNQKICDISGYSKEELIGKSSRFLYPTEEEYTYVGKEKYDQIKKNGTGTVETSWKRKDGIIVDILLSSSPLDQNNLSKGVTFTVLDISEQKQTQNKLIKNKTILSKSQRIAHIGSWSLDLKTKQLSWSNEAYKIFGIENTGKNMTYKMFLHCVHPDDREMVNRTYTTAMENNEPYELIHRILRPDGKIRTVYEKSQDVTDEFGKTTFSIGIVHDITVQDNLIKILQEN